MDVRFACAHCRHLQNLQICKLTGPLRIRLAKSPAFTFAATVTHLCHAIRKLSAITPEEDLEDPSGSKQKLYRGVRGELPESFWLPDEQGMVGAVGGGVISTSKKQHNPHEDMGKGSNVLWELHTSKEDDAAYHRGAEVSKLSQFAAEDEVLFPPCTLLVVRKQSSQAPSSGHGRPSSGVKVSDLDSAGGNGAGSGTQSGRGGQEESQERPAARGKKQSEAFATTVRRASEEGLCAYATSHQNGDKHAIVISVEPHFV